ncbi:MAG: leukotriene A4 hydrolase C-terminal domain-containing protein, partial [Bacteroidota bacterium]
TEEYKSLLIDDLIYGPGLTANCPTVKSERIEKVDVMVHDWSAGTVSSADLPWKDWLYQERYRFLTNLPESVTKDQLKELDDLYNVTATGNNEVLFAWLEQSIKKQYQPAYPRVEQFLVSVGRRKFLTPLYRAMKETDQMDMAVDIYSKARPNYHSVATGTMDELLKRVN